MAECHSTSTPVDTRAKLSTTNGAPVTDPSEYRSLAGALQYLTLTRHDLAYAVQQVCLLMHDPPEPHLALIKRILRYVNGTLVRPPHRHWLHPVLVRLLRRRLGWVSRLSAVYLRLLRLPQRQPGLLVLQAPNDGLEFQWRPSIVPWPKQSSSAIGFVSCCRNSMFPLLRRWSSIVKTSVPST
jgi:hypothetical protein